MRHLIRRGAEALLRTASTKQAEATHAKPGPFKRISVKPGLGITFTGKALGFAHHGSAHGGLIPIYTRITKP